MSALVFRSAAAADLRRAFRWYEAEREGLGEEFLEAVRRAVEKVGRAPQAHAVIHRDTRRVLVPRFPYGLYYRIVGDSLVVVACYHLHRQPAGWKRRR